MNVEDRKDILTKFDPAAAKSVETEPVKGDADKANTDEDYHNAAALAHRPSSH